MANPCTLILPAITARYFETLLGQARQTGFLTIQTIDRLFEQLLAQIPEDEAVLRSGDFQLSIEIERNDLLHMLPLCSVYTDDETRKHVGAGFLVQAKKALQLPLPEDEKLPLGERGSVPLGDTERLWPRKEGE